MLVLHPGLFHVERFSQGFNRAESLVRIGWAGKRPGGSQRPPPRRSPPPCTLWALRLTRSPLLPTPGRACRETHPGCGRPLESILRHLRLCRLVCCRWWRVFCVCPVVCRSCGCCVAASLVLSVPFSALPAAWSAQLQARISLLPLRSLGRISRGSLPAWLSQRSPSESVIYGPPMLVGFVGDVRLVKHSTWNFFVARVCGWRETGWFLIRLPWKRSCIQ